MLQYTMQSGNQTRYETQKGLDTLRQSNRYASRILIHRNLRRASFERALVACGVAAPCRCL